MAHSNYYAGIYVPEGKTLTIKQHTLENGSLTVTSNGLGAAIGANWDKNCGNIVIESGTGGIVYPNGITDNPFVYPNSEAIDQIQADPSRGVKFLRNGQLLILRGDHTYSVTGQEVR